MAFKSLYVIIYDFMTMLSVEILKNVGNQTVLMTIEFQRGEKNTQTFLKMYFMFYK